MSDGDWYEDDDDGEECEWHLVPEEGEDEHVEDAGCFCMPVPFELPNGEVCFVHRHEDGVMHEEVLRRLREMYRD